MTTTTGPARDVLTQEEAEARAARVSNVTYDVRLDLTRGAQTYRGETTIRFELTGDGATFLDFRGMRIDTLEVNGVPVIPHWNGYRLTLPEDALRTQNVVSIAYENEYDHTGDGFHQFIDPEDTEEYLYTNFEPYEQHRLFPAFDQPDIKGVYHLTVTAPSEWQVIGNSRIATSTAAGDGRTRHVFEPTARISTYLFALIVGPYVPFRDVHKGIPLGFFCRRSLVKYIDIDELFTITKQGLDFYADFFAYAYPFTKYDQIFVPEFNAGAMENVGAVTHSERMVFRDPPTDRQRLDRAEVILHEMAHMWFGDLVTMKWWNDLWLNESFATYMAYLAMAKATRFTSAWRAFNSRMKMWAYRQDQLVTTHPIAGQVADTDQTFLNFDGITYGKGAAALQQLVAYIGLERFRDGMRRYFQRYAYSNATLHDFLAALEEGSGRDLQAWSRLWLETPSLNTLAAVWEVDGDRLTSLTLRQTAPPDYPTLRPHRVEVALFSEQDGTTALEALPAEIDGAEAEVTAARGRRAPQLVFPNHNDLTFAKVALDDRSLAYLRAHLERIEDPLLRQLLWSSLWTMVRDRQLKSTEYLALVRDKVVLEPDLELVETTLEYATTAIAVYVPESRREREAHALFEVAWQALQSAPPGDAQIIWARALIRAATLPEDLTQLARLADGEVSVPGLTIDQQMRWDIAIKHIARDMPGAEARLAAERARDPSDRGQRAALRAEASRPSPEAKAAVWDRVHGEGYGSLHLTSAAMSGFNWPFQRDLLEPYVEAFFARVPEIFETRVREFATAYFGNLFPGYRVEQAVLDRSTRLLAEVGDRLPVLARLLREANDDLARAIAVRAYAET